MDSSGIMSIATSSQIVLYSRMPGSRYSLYDVLVLVLEIVASTPFPPPPCVMDTCRLFDMPLVAPA